MKLGAARSKAPSAWRLVETDVDDKTGKPTSSLDREKLGRRERRHLSRANPPDDDPTKLRQYDIQLVAAEEAVKTLRGDFTIRPAFHQDEKRVEAHIFIAFLACCLQIAFRAFATPHQRTSDRVRVAPKTFLLARPKREAKSTRQILGPPAAAARNAEGSIPSQALGTRSMDGLTISPTARDFSR